MGTTEKTTSHLTKLQKSQQVIGYSNYALRLPASLKHSVEQVARDDGTSLNQFIVTAIAEKLAALKTEDYFQERAKRGNLDAAMALLNRTGGEPPQAGDEIL